MKLFDGQISLIPNKPHTGLVGLLIKHREQLEPGNKISGNAAIHLLATARAIIEAMGGKQVDGQWEVEIGGGKPIDVEEIYDAINELGHRSEGLSTRLSVLEHSREVSSERCDDLLNRIDALTLRVAELEKVASNASASVPQDEKSPEVPRRGRRSLADLPPIGMPKQDKGE